MRAQLLYVKQVMARQIRTRRKRQIGKMRNCEASKSIVQICMKIVLFSRMQPMERQCLRKRRFPRLLS